jgi:hypothetical protein
MGTDYMHVDLCLDGQWYHDGKPTRILGAPDNRSITIINEHGQKNDGYEATNRDLVIPSRQ